MRQLLCGALSGAWTQIIWPESLARVAISKVSFPSSPTATGSAVRSCAPENVAASRRSLRRRLSQQGHMIGNKAQSRNTRSTRYRTFRRRLDKQLLELPPGSNQFGSHFHGDSVLEHAQVGDHEDTKADVDGITRHGS